MVTPLNVLEQQLAADGDRRMKLRKFAQMVDRHPDTLKRWAARGELKLVKTTSRGHDIWLSEAVRYLRQHEPAAA